ncbi:adenosine deaminase [Enterococcus sp. JM4C]|uniref:adenosine deaminase n=1 Tax=Candidatus Enterococcus huntleyi TaxID=1857217 RepID=UPI001379EFDD|nr:adenosine deaminase [Enterococcus sp. JM4C]KAF1299412.1 adenosine deaminase [Enterococcus sp. JM4C]
MLDHKTIQSLPKVELHCHLDGSVPLDTLKKLARKEGLDEELLARATAPKKCADLREYLESFDIILPLLQSEENLAIAAYDLIEQVSKENVCYIEIRFAPLLHQQQGLQVEQIIQAVVDGIKKAQQTFDVRANLIISAMRHHTDQQNADLVSRLKSMIEPAVVGFDFAGDEQQNGNDKISATTTLALNAGLGLTLHSGECGCAQNVVEAIQLGATRIGHGVAIRNSPEVMKICAETKTLLELCPTSNLQTNAIPDWDAYPLRLFIDNGVACCINTDNRTVSETTLTHEYALLASHCQLTVAEMKQLNINAINGSFASDLVKKELLEKVTLSYP